MQDCVIFHLTIGIELMLFSTVAAKPPDVEKAKVIIDYDAKTPDQLTIQVGETVEIIDKQIDSGGWWKVRNH